MPSTYSPSLRIELIGAGEQSGTWNVTTNNNLGALIEQAITGRTTVDVTAGNATLTSLNGVVDEARSAVLAVTGTPGVTRIITIPNVAKLYTVINSTANIVQIKTASGTAYDCPPLSQSYINCNGSDVVTGRSITDGANAITSLAAPFASPTFTGTTTATNIVIAANSTTDGLRITQTGSGNALLVEDSANPDASPFVVDTTGIILSGQTTKAQYNHYTPDNRLQIANTTSAVIQTATFENSISGATYSIAKSRSGTIGTNTVVQINDALGSFVFLGADGTGYIKAAEINAEVDGTPGTSDMPGRLVFSTTPDGASTTTERMRIANSGVISLGAAPGSESLRVTPVAGAVNYWNVQGDIGEFPKLSAQGSSTNVSMVYATKGAGSHFLQTNGSVTQLLIAHTASAVNYLQVTGGVTGGSPLISAQGSDTNIDVQIVPKGTGGLRFAGPLLPNNLAGTSGQVLTSAGAGTVPTWTTPTTGTVTSVGGTGTVSGLSLSGTVTTSGDLTLGGTLAVTASNFSSQTAATFLAAPNASAGVPTFRTIVAADIPTLNQNTTGSAATLTTSRTLWGQSFNGSANITAPLLPAAGSSSAPAFSTSGDTNTGMWFPAADTIAFSEGGAEAMRIDSSGNVGIGTSSPSAKLQVYSSGSNAILNTSLTDNPIYSLSADGYATAEYSIDRAAGIKLGGTGAIPLIFSTNSTERMRISSGGNLYLGLTAPSSATKAAINWNSSTEEGLVLKSTSATFTTSPILFLNNVNGLSGFIGQATSTVSYNTSSDYRLKENVAPMTGALAKVAALKPVTYTWKADGSAGQGFIAHELQAVVPDCVTGAKDAVDENGNIRPQGVDTSFLVATLTAAIQEQQAIISAMEARLAALEA